MGGPPAFIYQAVDWLILFLHADKVGLVASYEVLSDLTYCIAVLVHQLFALSGENEWKL